jgi:predicted DNA-binding mobile mystery protein A
MKNHWLTIQQLDQQLKEWQAVSNKYGKPRAGWIKTLRVALMMSAEQFAKRLGLSRARVNQLESAETHDAVTLRTLREAANALGCELVYAIVPKGGSTLEGIIKTRAEEIAKERVVQVAHSMSLENQSINVATLEHLKEEIAINLIQHLNKSFWMTPYKNSPLAEGIADILFRETQDKMQVSSEKNLINNAILNDPDFMEALKKALNRYQTKNDKQK